jgi:hypothetical protein
MVRSKRAEKVLTISLMLSSGVRCLRLFRVDHLLLGLNVGHLHLNDGQGLRFLDLRSRIVK